MKILGWEFQRAKQDEKAVHFDTVLGRLIAAMQGGVGEVNPENCMRSPTVQAIVTAISRRIAVSALHVYQKGMKNGRETKELLPSHPVAKLLAYPNSWQSRVNYWHDATSALVRYGNYYAYKSRGSTGPIRELVPIHSRSMEVTQDPDTYRLSYKVNGREVPTNKVHHVRGPSRNFYLGDSPVNDVAQAIALEIAAENFGASFFENGAVPLMMFKYMAGTARFKTAEDEKQFIQDFQEAFSGNKRHRAMLVPKGLERDGEMKIENDKAQFLETRKYQRTVIAGAFGVPPHLVGDLERATFNNVEQQDADFTLNVVMPVTQCFEAAMERDLLTDEDVARGVVIRFNLDSILRADFRTRQEGLQIQKNNGVISANEWREIERMNPIEEDDGGDDYVRPANFVVAGEEPPAPAPVAEPEAQKHEIHIHEAKQDIHITPHSHVGVNMEPQSIRIDGATVNVKSPDIEINAPTRVDAPTITIEPSNVTVTPSDITVNGSPVNVNNDVKTPSVNVEGTTVNVPPQEVTVAAPNVVVHNDVKTPVVTIEPAQVHVDNHMEPPSVTVKNTVDAPIVNVAAPNVSVAAPNVQVKNELPDYQVTEQQVVRDAKGRTEKLITTRKKKG
jgi:HK97 family phage portal protein